MSRHTGVRCALKGCRREAYPGFDYCCSDHRDQASAPEALKPCGKCGSSRHSTAMHSQAYDSDNGAP